ncbi:hypothetical protein GCM10009771_04520 [Nesterenkonia flava]
MRTPVQRTPRLGALIAWVALAGAAGALARVGLGELIPEYGMRFPWTTFLVNVLGSALMGLLAGILFAWKRAPGWALPVLGTGFLGSFTTFSAVMLAVLPSVPGGGFAELSAVTMHPAGAFEMFSYLVISILFSTAAAAGGLTVGRALFGCYAMDCDDETEGRT